MIGFFPPWRAFSPIFRVFTLLGVFPLVCVEQHRPKLCCVSMCCSFSITVMFTVMVTCLLLFFQLCFVVLLIIQHFAFVAQIMVFHSLTKSTQKYSSQRI